VLLDAGADGGMHHLEQQGAWSADHDVEGLEREPVGDAVPTQRKGRGRRGDGHAPYGTTRRGAGSGVGSPRGDRGAAAQRRPGGGPEAVVLYTDGLTEARGPGDAGFFEDDRVREVVGRGASAGAGAQAIADQLVSAAVDFRGGDARDDIAVLVLRVPA